MRRHNVLVAVSSVVILLLTAGQAIDARQQQTPPPKPATGGIAVTAVGDVALQIAAANPGVLLTVGWAKSIDPKAVEVNFDEVDSKLSKADMARVLLEVTCAVSRFDPTVIVYSRKGDQRMLLSKADLPGVVNEFERGNKLAAVRVFAESVKRPTGESFPLPAGLLPRTTAAFDVGTEFRSATQSGAVGDSAEKAPPSQLGFDPPNDKWKPSSEGEHGPLIQGIVGKIRPQSVKLKDGRRVEAKDFDVVLNSLLTEIGAAFTNVHVINKQKEQGGIQSLPDGVSELTNVRIQFDELLPLTDDAILIPITDVLLKMAPESTFVGQTAYGRNSEVNGRIVGKGKTWRYITGTSFYEDYLTTDKGELGRGRWSGEAGNLKWGDVKKKLALEFSQRKIDEDSEMERSALRRR